MKYFSCAETAKFVRKALKESFPDVKFRVRCSSYSGGASMRVEWLDGPNTDQVESVAKHFKAAYFDSSIDFQGSIYHMINGEQVHFGADYINCERQFSDASIQKAINAVYRRFAQNFREDQLEKPTVEQYRKGVLHNVHLTGIYNFDNRSVQASINNTLYKQSDRLVAQMSKTVSATIITHDDGYSRSNGSGMSVVSLESTE